MTKSVWQEAIDEAGTPLGDLIWSPRRRYRNLIRRLERLAHDNLWVEFPMGMWDLGENPEKLRIRSQRLRAMLYTWGRQSQRCSNLDLWFRTHVGISAKDGQVVMYVNFFSKYDMENSVRITLS